MQPRAVFSQGPPQGAFCTDRRKHEKVYLLYLQQSSDRLVMQSSPDQQWGVLRRMRCGNSYPRAHQQVPAGPITAGMQIRLEP